MGATPVSKIVNCGSTMRETGTPACRRLSLDGSPYTSVGFIFDGLRMGIGEHHWSA